MLDLKIIINIPSKEFARLMLLLGLHGTTDTHIYASLWPVLLSVPLNIFRDKLHFGRYPFTQGYPGTFTKAAMVDADTGPSVRVGWGRPVPPQTVKGVYESTQLALKPAYITGIIKPSAASGLALFVHGY